MERGQNKTKQHPKTKPKQPTEHGGRRLLKVLLKVHAWVRQRVKQRLGNELEQKNHEIGHPRCGMKCLLAHHDTGQWACLSRLCHRALMNCVLRTHLWNGSRRKHLKRHGQTSRAKCDKLHLRQNLFKGKAHRSSSAHDFRPWKTTIDKLALTR